MQVRPNRKSSSPITRLSCVQIPTFRPGEVEVSTEAGAIRVQSTRFRRRATLLTRSGGADIRLSDFLRGIDVITEDPGDRAFLNNVVQGPAAFRGAGKVVVAANTFELAPGSGLGEVLALGSDLAFVNNLAQSDMTLEGDPGLMVVGNAYQPGRPSIEGNPPELHRHQQSAPGAAPLSWHSPPTTATVTAREARRMRPTSRSENWRVRGA
jgi:hypothetical protein